MTYRKKLVASALAVVGLAILTGCGGATPPPGYAPGKTGSNPTTPPGGVAGGCIAMNPYAGGGAAAVGFRGQNVYFNWTNVVGGILPMAGQQSVGQVQVTGGAGGATMGGLTLSRANWRNTQIVMQVSGSQQHNQAPYQGYPNGSFPYQNQQYNPYSGYPYGGTYQAQLANITGSIYLSPEELYYMTGGMFGGGYYGGMMPTYPGQYPTGGYPQQQQQLCFSGMGFDLGVYNGILYAGNVYLYINGGQPVTVEF